jgi:ubiquitin C-terminal hydrolase
LFLSLLANSAVGKSCTIRTSEFSNALGLDHYEQQDPNEFSRLLLERMHESFQGSPQEAGPNQGGHDLAKLLPHIFQGIITYETTCLTCQNMSKRSEEFMDLNLPIVHPSDITPRKAGQQSILEAFVSSADTDLQFCLDRYCYKEILDGDNQYHCSQCDCKRDAKRELTFQKLPPVLNVQLSRYVFDRVNFQKKKLSDKVLLPTVMQVKARGKERKAEPVVHRYILCAVMRHKGTSAYSGHYVAEAMDWLTGLWFEFNDEKVTLLTDGPSCSYDPAASTASNAKSQSAAADGSKKRKTASISGSQDAYNMYYVEEAFLAQATLDSLRPKASLGDPYIIERIGKMRKDLYKDLKM